MYMRNTEWQSVQYFEGNNMRGEKRQLYELPRVEKEIDMQTDQIQ